MSKVLFFAKTYELDLKNVEYEQFNIKIISLESSLFNEYKEFDFNIASLEEKIYVVAKDNLEIWEKESFEPGEIYEKLLSKKEKKSLGQVYTPKAIVAWMVENAFKNKKITPSIKILDPSCGGGYFLFEAFKVIKLSLKEQVDSRYILENMIFGVDIDKFAAFLTKVGLAFLSKEYGVNTNILSGDFLSMNLGSSPLMENRFDFILGNPPYVGHKNSSFEYRDFLYRNFSDVFYDKADISYCFVSKSKRYLKDDGILCFLVSRYFMEALYGDRIRGYIKDNYLILSIVDYNGCSVFNEANISAAILVLKNKPNNFCNNNSFSYVKYNNLNDASDEFLYPQEKLNNKGWVILEDAKEKLYNKIEFFSNYYLGDLCSMKQGVITGFDKAFVVDEQTIKKYKIEEYLLKKWIKNSNITRHEVKYNNLYLIYSDLIENENDFPNTINYLKIYKEALSNRREVIKGYRKWYELQWGRKFIDFENGKIVFPYKSKNSNFYFDKEGYFASADVYIMNEISSLTDYGYLANYLNSNVFEFYFKSQAKRVGKDIFEYYPNKLKDVRVYIPGEDEKYIYRLGKNSIDIFLKKVFNISEEENQIIKEYIYKKGDDTY